MNEIFLMFNIIIHVFQMALIAFEWNIILMFKIIIHVFQMDINCINEILF